MAFCVSRKSFCWWCALLALVLLACFTRGFGSLYGFVSAFGTLIAAIPALSLLQAGSTQLGMELDHREALAAVAGLYATGIGSFAVAAALAYRRLDLDRARLRAFKAILMAALPLSAMISMETMAQNWP